MIKETLDACGLLCPMPVIRTQQAIKKLQPGDELEIHCTDPGTMHDIPTWCRMYGHEVLQVQQREQNFVFRIKVVAQQQKVDDNQPLSGQEW